MLQFEWDPNKNRINQQKHKVSFEEASTAFYDPCAVVLTDPEHSEYEERFVLLGFSSLARLLMVCHCIKGENNTIRLISARKATKTETDQYIEMEG